MTRDPQMATLPDAIDWLKARWDGQRTAPQRIHAAHLMDSGGAPEWSGQFAHILAWRPGEVRRVEVTTICGHPLNGGRATQCLECDGLGVKTVDADRYTYPMTVALRRLRRAKGDPHPLALVYALATFGWRSDVVAQVTGAEAHELLRAIRQLHGRYEAGPVAVAWTQMSDSQRAAIEAGEVAA